MKKILDPFEGGYFHEVLEEYPELEEVKDGKLLAQSKNIRSLRYSSEHDILLSEIEGDYRAWKNPTDKKIEEKIQEYPKLEVSAYGEKFDSRFEREKSDAENFSGGDE